MVGAHLSGMPLNGELTALGGRRLETALTAPDYRMFALAESQPVKPGLVRVPAGQGAAIEVEVWALRAEGFVCSVDRIRDELGFTAATPLREGLAETRRWYRAQGWV